MMTNGNERLSDHAGDSVFEESGDRERNVFVADLTRHVVRKHELAAAHERVLRLLSRVRLQPTGSVEKTRSIVWSGVHLVRRCRFAFKRRFCTFHDATSSDCHGSTCVLIL